MKINNPVGWKFKIKVIESASCQNKERGSKRRRCQLPFQNEMHSVKTASDPSTKMTSPGVCWDSAEA
jgi:hypothetical protein